MHAGLLLRALPKHGSAPNEYEDAWAAAGTGSNLGLPLRCALADGATETSFARLWASMLVRAFASGLWEAAEDEGQALAALRRRWWRVVAARPLPWHAQEKVRQGACATFLGLQLEPRRGGICVYKAAGAGDCCLFQVRGGRLLAAFPVDVAARLPLRPHAVCSTAGEVALWRTRGQGRAGDAFYLMTDALAGWFLREGERGGEPWLQLAAVAGQDPAAFIAWVARRRGEGSLRNDDVTLAVLGLREA